MSSFFMDDKALQKRCLINYFKIDTLNPNRQLIIMAFAATITETMVDELDDNLIVPIVSGFIGQIFFLAI